MDHLFNEAGNVFGLLFPGGILALLLLHQMHLAPAALRRRIDCPGLELFAVPVVHLPHRPAHGLLKEEVDPLGDLLPAAEILIERNCRRLIRLGRPGGKLLLLF